MKLGFWNRLALVASVLTTLGVPTYWVIDAANSSAEASELGFASCMKFDNADYTECRDLWDYSTPAPWGEWPEAALAVAVACAAGYALIWITVRTAKWIWRGRSVDRDRHPSP